ncbi:hypothetical protein DV735_g196, partial [Chaetothyriales sp. CBS 134920]
MQYVRNFGSGVSKTWNSINPATLSGAIDVIVVEQADGTLACSPFHVRFGKFSLLRPFEKRVEFQVNGVKQNYAMKLGETGEAFFVFETSNDIPESLQTSPLASPAASPQTVVAGAQDESSPLGEPTPLDINANNPIGDNAADPAATESGIPIIQKKSHGVNEDRLGGPSPGSTPEISTQDGTESLFRPLDLDRTASENMFKFEDKESLEDSGPNFRQHALSSSAPPENRPELKRSASPPALPPQDAYNRAMTLSHKLSSSNIRTQVTKSGDLMLDMTGYKSSEEDALRAESIARKLLSEELEGSYDIGSLIGTDEDGNLWIYSSEEARDAANKKAIGASMDPPGLIPNDTASDPGYHSDTETSSPPLSARTHQRAQSEEAQSAPRVSHEGTRNFAKTLRLTSDQLKQLELKPGANPMSFTVGRATCPAFMYYWTSTVPIVISDIDGTITKSDTLGHILNMVGRDWTHQGVAKLYSEIVANGYNIFYLTSRSVGQADMTRAYLNTINQEGWKLPKGPVIMSPDRTIAALRREVYLRKPEVFKMACLRDILSLFPGKTNPFYAGFGNRFTDALSYRTVNIPSTRIFTINTNSEVSIDLMSLSHYRSSYVSMREVVDHFFPPVSTLVKEGGEDYTDFSYWRDDPDKMDGFIPSCSEDETDEEDDNAVDGMGDSYLSQESVDQPYYEGDSVRESIEVDDVEISRLRIVDSDITDDYLVGDDPVPASPRAQGRSLDQRH